MLLQRWPSSPDCQQKAVFISLLCAEALNCAWDPGTGQLDLCNEAHHTHACTHYHTHTHTAAVVRSRAAEFITAIYYPLLYQRNVIPRCVSDACAALPLWSIIGRWQRWSRGCWWMSVPGPAVITPSIECSCETLPTKWPRSTNMAPVARSERFTCDDQHRVLDTFICCSHVFGHNHHEQSCCSDSSASSQQSAQMKSIYTWYES